MLRWAIVFFVLVILSAVVAFTTVFTAAIGVAKFLFFIFLALFFVALAAGLFFTKKLTGRK